MPTQRYSVTQPPIETIFTWIKSGEIAIPEIQRSFVWTAVKVRDLLDSLFQGYPVGYLNALPSRRHGADDCAGLPGVPHRTAEAHGPENSNLFPKSVK
jgi:uncharacterized protein with ParB-like and HNH nuclease domain